MVQSLFCLWISNDYPNSLVVFNKKSNVFHFKQNRTWIIRITQFCILLIFFFFCFCCFPVVTSASHAIVYVNSTTKKSFYFYYRLSLVTRNYDSTPNDGWAADNKESHPSFTLWNNAFTPNQKNCDRSDRLIKCKHLSQLFRSQCV